MRQSGNTSQLQKVSGASSMGTRFHPGEITHYYSKSHEYEPAEA